VFMRNRIDRSRAGETETADGEPQWRARLILEVGHSWAEIRDKLDFNDAFINRWSKWFGRERLAWLFSRHAGHGPTKLTPALEAQVLD
jgi:hypothetical protein